MGDIKVPKMASITQAAAATTISKSALRELVRSGKVRYVKSGCKYLINLDSLAEYLNGSGRKRQEADETSEDYPQNLIEKILYESEGRALPSDYRGSVEYILAETLSKREQKVICLRYRNKLTLAEVGRQLDLTSERIRQIEKKALVRLRHHSRAKYLKDGVKGVERAAIQKAENTTIKRTTNELRELCKTLRQCDDIKAIMTQDTMKEMSKPLEERNIEAQLNTPLEELNLSMRAYNVLKRAGFSTLSDIALYSVEEIREIRNLGSKTLDEIKNVFLMLGLAWEKEQHYEDVCPSCETDPAQNDGKSNEELRKVKKHLREAKIKLQQTSEREDQIRETYNNRLELKLNAQQAVFDNEVTRLETKIAQLQEKEKMFEREREKERQQAVEREAKLSESYNRQLDTQRRNLEAKIAQLEAKNKPAMSQKKANEYKQKLRAMRLALEGKIGQLEKENQKLKEETWALRQNPTARTATTQTAEPSDILAALQKENQLLEDEVMALRREAKAQSKNDTDAHWVVVDGIYLHCSHCRASAGFECDGTHRQSKFCPNCGARMSGNTEYAESKKGKGKQ